VRDPKRRLAIELVSEAVQNAYEVFHRCRLQKRDQPLRHLLPAAARFFVLGSSQRRELNHLATAIFSIRDFCYETRRA
jgi:hypothetical protein